ncbi:hypothetical protein KUCAC02_036728 [Chaenocephalus aceratus]|nr:hypothetical protein KUCAC02_036728 [Chaenocephalus aceratus]
MFWRAVTGVELRNRSDIGQVNTSPQTTILPALRVPSNCRRDFHLLDFDPDGDEVRCRYANSSLSECIDCTTPSVLSLSESCILVEKRHQNPMEVLNWPCHTQGIERVVKMVTEASAKYFSQEKRDGGIRAQEQQDTDVQE